jgi:L-alanine-DL-glutamate epimerase-like enolase superfamily enzyme
LSSALATTDLVEYMSDTAYIDGIVPTPYTLDQDGMLDIPTTPGLGVEFDFDALSRYTDVTRLLAP